VVGSDPLRGPGLIDDRPAAALFGSPAIRRRGILVGMSPVSQLLDAAAAGDGRAAADLFPLVYAELRDLAAARLAGEKPGQTLQPTALVHEAFLRLAGDQRFEGRGHFFAGLSIEQTAEVLGVSRATAYRQWAFARAWLRTAFGDADEPAGE
jgi:DNA-directed RNA polymerase specialized sigma24 family protein